MPYDERSLRGKAGRRRYDSGRVVDYVGGLALFAAIVALILFFVITGSHDVQDEQPTPPTHTMTPMSVTLTDDGSTIGAYVITDPDTQVQYVVTDRGGITPRLRRDGTPYGSMDDSVSYD